MTAPITAAHSWGVDHSTGVWYPVSVHRYPVHVHTVAAGLAFLAGFVDATGFLKLGGFFVSFMSGNTTRLGVGLGSQSNAWMIAGGLILIFVGGVVLGTLLKEKIGATKEAPLLSFVALLLGIAALCGELGLDILAIAAMTLAMGAVNTVFARDGDVHIGLTYMTGALVKMGQRLALALRGGAPFAFLPYLQLWLGLALGAFTGAAAFQYWNLRGLWFAALAFGCFAIAAPWIDFKPAQDKR